MEFFFSSIMQQSTKIIACKNLLMSHRGLKFWRKIVQNTLFLAAELQKNQNQNFETASF